jgi:teichuronic acid biosynthesis glycosyltransferase TuaH
MDMATRSPGDTTATTQERSTDAASLVVCSLEPWGEVRRRMQILTDELVDLDPSLRVLYVAPALDVPHELRQGNLHGMGGRRLRQVRPRVHALRPHKWLPRSVGPYADRSLERQVHHAVDALGLRNPLLWVNDAGYAEFAVRTGWPCLYDITDDWLLTPLAPRQRDRLASNERLLLEHSGAVVVCSPDLERTRGRDRTVELIPNGVDVELFRTPRDRPASLPPAPVALYVGTLHEWRLDVPLILELAASRPDVHIALLGPNCLPTDVTAQLERVPTVHLLGPRPYDQIPAFMQHADVVVIPHLVNPFTESLDPIKAYECLAAGRPTVAIPVAGFRQLGPPIVTAERSGFVAATSVALAGATPPGLPAVFEDTPVPTWRRRAEMMASVMGRVRQEGNLR